MPNQNTANSIGSSSRIHVIGTSCAGKSTLASELAESFDLSPVELDALNWQPGWIGLHETDPEQLADLIDEATEGDSWVVSGSYLSHCQNVFWPRLDFVIWLDLPRWLLIRRFLVRSWRRWKNRELLWGTNYEQFWPQLQIWKREESLLWWIWTQYHPQKQKLIQAMDDSNWQHIHFIRLRSVAKVNSFRESLAG